MLKAAVLSPCDALLLPAWGWRLIPWCLAPSSVVATWVELFPVPRLPCPADRGAVLDSPEVLPAGTAGPRPPASGGQCHGLGGCARVAGAGHSGVTEGCSCWFRWILVHPIRGDGPNPPKQHSVQEKGRVAQTLGRKLASATVVLKVPPRLQSRRLT